MAPGTADLAVTGRMMHPVSRIKMDPEKNEIIHCLELSSKTSCKESTVNIVVLVFTYLSMARKILD